MTDRQEIVILLLETGIISTEEAFRLTALPTLNDDYEEREREMKYNIGDKFALDGQDYEITEVGTMIYQMRTKSGWLSSTPYLYLGVTEEYLESEFTRIHELLYGPIDCAEFIILPQSRPLSNGQPLPSPEHKHVGNPFTGRPLPQFSEGEEEDTLIVPATPNSCTHEYINVGFTHEKLVCKHCDLEKGDK
jgi:hypothetical protein